MKRVLVILLAPLLLLAVALVDSTTRESLTGTDRGGFTEIYVEASGAVAAGTAAGDTVVTHIVNREPDTTEVTWFLSIDGRETLTGTVTLAPGADQVVRLEMPEVTGTVWAEFKLLGKPQTLRWRVKEQ